jgi:ferritin
MGHEGCWYRSMEKSVLKVSNHSDISSTLQSILDQYSKLFNARHFVQWYVHEGMEEGEFADAGEAMANIIHSMKVPNFFPVQDDEDDME